VIIYRN